ncbi:alpha/beta fold hydrolase [Roseateles sp. DC23W]|uniref:Alpha/beta fold hydrolase n=1 Tax=Pelomonas dachongensis TaxID=3299029 RepID=A0ABW7EP38_9BURK
MAETSPSTTFVCLHSSAASGKQWRRLIADATEAGETWQWHAPDLYGHGSAAAWPAGRPNRLDVEADGVLAGLPLLTDEPFHLVAHSYGAATALQVALLQPQRVQSLTLYEPVAFGVLGDDVPGAREARQVAQAVVEALDRGDLQDAARGFVGYWQDRDIWPELDDAQRQRLAEPMPTVRRHFEALNAARWTDAQLATLQMPVQLVCGGATRASARAVSQALSVKLPRVQLAVVEGAAHLAPIGDPARVNPLLLDGMRRGLNAA